MVSNNDVLCLIFLQMQPVFFIFWHFEHLYDDLWFLVCVVVWSAFISFFGIVLHVRAKIRALSNCRAFFGISSGASCSVGVNVCANKCCDWVFCLVNTRACSFWRGSLCPFVCGSNDCFFFSSDVSFCAGKVWCLQACVYEDFCMWKIKTARIKGDTPSVPSNCPLRPSAVRVCLGLYGPGFFLLRAIQVFLFTPCHFAVTPHTKDIIVPLYLFLVFSY